MSRRWLGIALLLSLGINVGIVAILLFDRASGGPAVEEALDEGPEEAADPATAPGLRRRGPGRFRGAPGPFASDPAAMIELRTAALADRLGLEGERRERFVAIQRELLSETHRRRRAVFELQERLRRELAAEEPSRELLEELVGEMAEHRAALDRGLAEAVLATRSLLAPGQERLYLRFLGSVQAGPPGGPDRAPGPRPHRGPGPPGGW